MRRKTMRVGSVNSDTKNNNVMSGKTSKVKSKAPN